MIMNKEKIDEYGDARIKNTYMIFLVISLVISVIMAVFVILAFRDGYFMDGVSLKGIIIGMFLVIILVSGYDILRSKERTMMWYLKLAVALIAVVTIPPIFYDLYVPPFMVFFFAMFFSSVMAVNGFILVPVDKKMAAVNIIIASVFPFNTPVLFYILYQVIQMPHIIEVAGICHVASIGDDNNATFIHRLQGLVFSERRAALRCKG